eukprot:Awhi_evm2s15804
MKRFPQDEKIQSSSLATLSWMTEEGLNNLAMLSLKMYLEIQKSLRFGILIENYILLRNGLYCLEGLFRDKVTRGPCFKAGIISDLQKVMKMYPDIHYTDSNALLCDDLLSFTGEKVCVRTHWRKSVRQNSLEKKCASGLMEKKLYADMLSASDEYKNS